MFGWFPKKTTTRDEFVFVLLFLISKIVTEKTAKNFYVDSF